MLDVMLSVMTTYPDPLAYQNRFDQGPLDEAEGDVAMRNRKLEVVKGSGNVFRDLGHKGADVDQFKAILAAEIIKALDRRVKRSPRTESHRYCSRRLLPHPECRS